MFRLFLCRETKTSSSNTVFEEGLRTLSKRGLEDKMDAFSQFSNRQITHSLSISARVTQKVPPQPPRPFSALPPPLLPPLPLLPPSP